MVKNTSDQAHVRQKLLAYFFASIKSVHACWFPIIIRGTSSSSNTNFHGLSLFMTLNYNDAYLPLMMACGLIKKQSINTRGAVSADMISPSICHGWSNKSNYTWDDFIAEFCLSLEVSHLYIEKWKTFLLG